ncbi:MAG: excinuclease ABC subunit UvrC [Treponema sp.]|jgi:excinuclease ABC subunit C|nr:excinuclease ABC subunit UvrC [Treponema sp.]
MKKQEASGNEENSNLESLKASAHDAPRLPGVYLWKDGEGQIIYIGKAKYLRDRLGSYFSTKDLKTTALLRRARSIETIIVANEYEALLLENTLIKQHTPKYNINLKDGKSYPVIRITADEFPKVFRTRRIIEDKSLYYGPFPDLQKVNAMMDIIDKLFPLRKCRTFKMRTGPCMYYHIQRCKAPCCGKIDAAEYRRHVEPVQRLLSGETSPLIMDLTEKMHEAAKAFRFERAAMIRDAILAIEGIAGENSSVVDLDPEGRDYIAWASEGLLATFTIFSMRGGKMTGRELYRACSAADEKDSLEVFITSYYNGSRPPPPKIYLQQHFDDSLLIGWFKSNFNVEPELPSVAEKRHEAIIAMARQNALEDLRKRLKERGAGPALDELARVLGLSERPQRIEGFDIAQLDGKHPVASLVSFRNGTPDKKNYRYFKLRSVIGVVDDFAAMREVVQRRYSRLIREAGDLPDLVLIDGGIGQVNAAKGVMDDLGINIPVVGLAKREEELWLPHAKEALVLSRRSEALKVLQFIRDETHRFATGLNQRLRSKDLFLPTLESVEGIGSRRAAAIIKAFGSVENIAEAEPAEIAERCRISHASAKAVRAAARLALEDRKANQQRLTAGAPQGGGQKRSRSVGESLAAEAAEPYETGSR